MPADPNPPSPNPGPTPTGYQRTSGGANFRWQPPTVEHLGKLLPQYDIEALLGHGGMGAVYRGTQRSLQRAVAIKILPPGLEEVDASYIERFKNEARVMARLDHPAIVPVYDFGETSEGQLYIVMAFVDGTDVQRMLSAQGRLPPEHALAVTAHVCDALHYAHTHGVIHRDIKPANILINMEGQVKVADFGLAKAEEAGSSGLTKTGMAMGTPDYVAPEALMMGVNVDGRADLYAIGVMLYAMLTGNVPRGAFKPASVMLPGTDPRFDGIVQKAMQMDREERYQTAAEIRRDLDIILTTPMVQAGGQSSAAIPQNVAASARTRNQKPMGKSAGVPVDGRRVRQNAEDPARTPDRALASAPTAKSKTPLLLGLGAAAALGIGAFVMLGGSDKTKQSGPLSPLSGTSGVNTSDSAQGTVRTTPTTPIKVREEPKPAVPAPAVVSSETKPTAPKPTVGDEVRSLTSKAGPTGAEPMKTGETKAGEPAKPTSPATSAPAAVSSSPPLPASPSSPDFPPGQWVKVFTKFEDLPQGWFYEDNYLLSKDKLPVALTLTKGDVRNVGVKLKVKITDSSGQSHIRLRRNNSSGLYIFGLLKDGRPTLRHQTSASGGEMTSLLKTISTLQFTPGKEVELEFATVGQLLIARLDGQLIDFITDNRISVGYGSLHNELNKIRDIEVINLDGLPEAEALRILGVDEKGNDLRALAAKQEQQKAEQAKVVDAIAAIPELKTLHEQFEKLQAERVSAPFEKDVAALNTSYLGGLDRKIAEMKQKGDLDAVLALEAEKKLVPVAGGIDPGAVARSSGPGGRHLLDPPGSLPPATAMPIPADDDQTLPALKALRQIYRDAFAKLEATRAANLKLLTDPLSARLKQLESTLTQQNRIDHAKTVREYREGLGRAAAPAAAAKGETATNPANPALAGASALPAAKYTEREVLDWLLSIGAQVTIKDGPTRKILNSGDKVPGGKIVIMEIRTATSDAKWPITDADFVRFNGLNDLERLDMGICENVTGAGLAQMGPLASLRYFEMQFPNFDSAHYALVPNFPKLRTLLLPSKPCTAQEIGALPALKELREFHGGYSITDEVLAELVKRKNLTQLAISNNQLTDNGLAALKELKELEILHMSGGPMTKVTGSGLIHLAELPKFQRLTVGNPNFEAKNAALITHLKQLQFLRVSGTNRELKDHEEWITHLSQLKGKLTEISLSPTAGFTPEQITHLQKALPKVKVVVN